MASTSLRRRSRRGRLEEEEFIVMVTSVIQADTLGIGGTSLRALREFDPTDDRCFDLADLKEFIVRYGEPLESR